MERNRNDAFSARASNQILYSRMNFLHIIMAAGLQFHEEASTAYLVIGVAVNLITILCT